MECVVTRNFSFEFWVRFLNGSNFHVAASFFLIFICPHFVIIRAIIRYFLYIYVILPSSSIFYWEFKELMKNGKKIYT